MSYRTKASSVTGSRLNAWNAASRQSPGGGDARLVRTSATTTISTAKTIIASTTQPALPKAESPPVRKRALRDRLSPSRSSARDSESGRTSRNSLMKLCLTGEALSVKAAKAIAASASP